MNCEDDFHAMLDAYPDDWQTRLVFADWLDDRGDPRAEAYRALGRMRVAPYAVWSGAELRWTYGDYTCAHGDTSELPRAWFALCFEAVPDESREEFPGGAWFWMPTRRGAEAVVVTAFARLPEERRAELLAGAWPKAGAA